MLRSNPKVRLALYAVALLALSVVLALNFFHVIDPGTANQATATIDAIAQALGIGGVSTAFLTLIRQLSNGTLTISGTPDEQLAQAANQYAQDTLRRRANEVNAQDALTQVLQSLPGGQVGATVTSDPGDVVTACGDALR